jgi:hypothetical protein
MEVAIFVVLILLLLWSVSYSVYNFLENRKLQKAVGDGLRDIAGCLEILNKETKGAVDAVNIASKSLDVTDENVALKIKHKEYKQALSTILDVLYEDTRFLRGDLFRRFGSVPEFQDVNAQIASFENRIQGITDALREYRMIEKYDDE